MKKAIHSFFLTAVALVNIFSSCNRPKEEYIEMKFEIPLTVTPIKDTINIGDTLTLETNFPDSVKEVKSGRYYKLQNFDFKTTISFLKLTSTSLFLAEQPGNTSDYAIVPLEGTIKNISESFADLAFKYSNGIYSAKVLLIPKAKGAFNIFIFSKYAGKNSYLDSLKLPVSSSGNKQIPFLTDVHYVINNGNTNYELLKQHSKLGSVVNPTPENTRQEKLSAFTFVVN